MIDGCGQGQQRLGQEEGRRGRRKSARPSQQRCAKRRSTQNQKQASSGSRSIVAWKLRGGAARQGTRRNLALDFRNKPECQISANKCQPTGTGAGADTGTAGPQVPVPARLAHRQQQASGGHAAALQKQALVRRLRRRASPRALYRYAAPAATARGKRALGLLLAAWSPL